MLYKNGLGCSVGLGWNSGGISEALSAGAAHTVGVNWHNRPSHSGLISASL